jgi:hypothetical protein
LFIPLCPVYNFMKFNNFPYINIWELNLIFEDWEMSISRKWSGAMSTYLCIWRGFAIINISDFITWDELHLQLNQYLPYIVLHFETFSVDVFILLLLLSCPCLHLIETWVSVSPISFQACSYALHKYLHWHRLALNI